MKSELLTTVVTAGGKTTKSVSKTKFTKKGIKKVNKTTWDWELINNSKPIWTRKPAEIEEDEYSEFYKR